MSAEWIEGHFEGVYSGPRRPSVDARSRHDKRRSRGASSELRRFGFEIESGRVRDLAPCDEPDPEAIGGDRVIRQSRLKRVRLLEMDDPESDRETSLFDVHISDWQLKHPAEGGDRAYGTIIGTIHARRRPSIVESPAARSETPIVFNETQPVPDDLEPASPGPARVLNANRESIDSDMMLMSPGWTIVVSLLWLSFAAIAYARGVQFALIWFAPIATALALYRFTDGGLVRGAAWWLIGILPAVQCFVMWSPLELAWQTGCGPVLGVAALGLVALPIVLSAVIGSRGSLWMTGAIWTAVLLSNSASADAAKCMVARAGEAVTGSETRSADQTPRRTDEQGRWPVMPADPISGIGPGPGGSSESSSPASPGGAAPPSAPGDLAADAPAPALAPGASPFADSARPAQDSPPSPSAQSATRGDRLLTQVDGGWLSPEHRGAPREHVLISVEQANRTPALFFDSGGAHRVYVPTDPIFEDASSVLRPKASLILARVAALLSLPSQQRVLLDVHSDSAGAPQNQIELSRRRAENVRSWLVDRGHVSPSRFEMRPIGGARPLVPPDGDYGAQQPNRRIEIRLVEER